MDVKAQRGPSGSSPSTAGSPRLPSLPQSAASSAQTHGAKSTTNSVKAWRPNLPDLPGSIGLTIPYSGSQPMSREIYELNQQQHLQELIKANPDLAQKLLTSSPERLPDLYEIATQSDMAEWPSRILACGQMQILLDRINWSKGTSLKLDPNELPTLDEVTQALLQ